MTLTPDRAVYAPGQPVVIDFGAPLDAGAEVVVTHLATEVSRVAVPAGARRVELGALPVGGYGVTVAQRRTACDVVNSRWERPRYGFIVDLDTDVDADAVAAFYRRLHLNAAQLYDWAYRHSQLLPPSAKYLDPLGQPRDLGAVNRMCSTLAGSSVAPLGYAAVYAIGHDETDDWRDSLLLRDSGEPYRLGDDFLVLVDPAEPRWLAHLTEQLAAVVEATAIEGFHLDQYGWPKFATRGDGARVDLARSFADMIVAVRRRLPDAPFMFNNVNDFPTHATAALPQDATYIEVWDPHSRLSDLGALATAARASRPDHPPILSAYLHCYSLGDERGATTAATLVMATAFSHGAAHLLLGEAGNALIDPYYPNNHPLAPDNIDVFADWYDFAVRYGDLLYGAELADVTEFYAGGINEDVVLTAAGVKVSTKADPGTVWLRVVRTPHGVVVHLINLMAQAETAWDAPKAQTAPVADASISISFVGAGAPVYAASPEAPDLVPLELAGVTTTEQINSLSAGQYGVRFALPTLGAWTLVWIPTESVGR